MSSTVQSSQTASLSGGYRIEMLSGDNWLPWKRRMLAILRDSDLEVYVAAIEEAALQDWKSGDSKTRTRIELAVGDSEMVHLSGAKTAREMWEQLTQIKEARGRSGILA
ncbi:hypothetical protein EXIGLDRAFT_617254, partial [Exidia glandulosa HHB12029]